MESGDIIYWKFFFFEIFLRDLYLKFLKYLKKDKENNFSSGARLILAQKQKFWKKNLKWITLVKIFGLNFAKVSIFLAGVPEAK